MLGSIYHAESTPKNPPVRVRKRGVLSRATICRISPIALPPNCEMPSTASGRTPKASQSQNGMRLIRLFASEKRIPKTSIIPYIAKSLWQIAILYPMISFPCSARAMNRFSAGAWNASE